MTKREYLKYNNPEAFDLQGKPIKPGDTVVINNNYTRTPFIGVVDHFTENGNLAIIYDWTNWKGVVVKCNAYRGPRHVVKIKDGNKSKKQNRS